MTTKPIKATEIPQEQAIFTAAWEFLKEFYLIAQDSPEEDWQEALKRYKEVFRMGDTPPKQTLARQLAAAVFRFIELNSKHNFANYEKSGE